MNFDLVDLDKPTLLRYVTEEQIFCKYLEIDEVSFTRQYYNVLRTDNSPGCTFFVRETDNRVIFHDWSREWKADCFDVVMARYACSFPKALEKIAADFNLIPSNIQLTRVKQAHITAKVPLTLRIMRREYYKPELDFWNIGDFVVTQEQLQANGIFTIKAFWEMRGEEIENYVQKTKMTFAYKFPGKFHYQIYRPELPRNRRRFINSPKVYYGDVEYLDKEVNYVVITKSKKDAFFLRLLGVNAMFIISEGTNLDAQLLEHLQLVLGYEYLFTLFDNDMTGKRRSVIYKQKYGTIPLLYPKELGKDTTEVLSFHRKAFMFDLVERVKRFYYL